MHNARTSARKVPNPSQSTTWDEYHQVTQIFEPSALNIRAKIEDELLSEVLWKGSRLTWLEAGLSPVRDNFGETRTREVWERMLNKLT